MASATATATARGSFTFSISTTSTTTQQSLPKLKSHLTFPPLIPKILSVSALHALKKSQCLSPAKSVDVSKEDKPTIPEETTKNTVENDKSQEEEKEEEGDGSKFDKRRLEEKFAVLNTGIFECRSCGYKYDEAAGDTSYPIPPGLPFDRLPEDWRCPTCGASKNFFQSKSVEIAGFAQNQQFGLGANTLTSGQKALLIWGGFGLGFLLFLSGYFLQ